MIREIENFEKIETIREKVAAMAFRNERRTSRDETHSQIKAPKNTPASIPKMDPIKKMGKHVTAPIIPPMMEATMAPLETSNCLLPSTPTINSTTSPMRV